MGGITAPPAIEETIKPDNSLVWLGMLSMVIEKISGKIFANPSPVSRTPTNVKTNELLNINKIPVSATTPVISNNFFGTIRAIINDPKKRPSRIGR